MSNSRPSGQNYVGSASQPCPLARCSILVQVYRADTGASVGGVTVKLSGPTAGEGQTAGGTGTKPFDPVKPGRYALTVALSGRMADEFEVERSPAVQVSAGEQLAVAVPLRRITHWIGISLVDEENQPVPGARYEVILPDRSTKRGTLDANGRARLSDLPPGQCKISFPDMDEAAWELR